jgi:hypothetical protein
VAMSVPWTVVVRCLVSFSPWPVPFSPTYRPFARLNAWARLGPFRLRRYLNSGIPRAIPAGPPACRPSLSLLSGRHAVSPRRLIDFRSQTHVTPAATKSRRRPAIQPRRYRQSLPSCCARLPSLGPRGVQHRLRKLDGCPPCPTEI